MTPAPLYDPARQGLLFVLSSPSGAGKSTLSRRLLESDPGFTLSVSATTRPPRPGETDGVDYHFVDYPEFRRMIDTGEMLEHANVFGNFYGTPRGAVEAALSGGRDVLFDVDWQGTQQLRKSALGGSVVAMFILPPSIRELERRLRARAQDSDEVIARRMKMSHTEISHWEEYDYVLINDDLNKCFAQIGTIIAAERLRRPRQRGLPSHVDALNREFKELFG